MGGPLDVISPNFKIFDKPNKLLFEITFSVIYFKMNKEKNIEKI